MVELRDQAREDSREESRFEHRYLQLVNAIHSASSANAIMVGVREQILDLFQVEMATIFIKGSSGQDLFSWLILPGEFLKKIRLPINHTSIAGYVAVTREQLVVNDAYDEDELRSINPALRFDASWDKQAGVRTRQILAAPIVYRKSLLGIIELVNTCTGTEFSSSDQGHLRDLAETLAIAIYNHSTVNRRRPLKYDHLVKNKLVSEKELDRALVIAAQQKVSAEQVLIENFRVSRTELGQVLASYFNTRYMNLDDLDFESGPLLKGTKPEYFRAAQLVPLQTPENQLVIVARDPEEQVPLIQEVKQVLRLPEVEIVLAFGDEIENFWQRAVDRDDTGSEETRESGVGSSELVRSLDTHGKEPTPPSTGRKSVLEPVDDRPVVQLVNTIIENAYERNASDIHIEPYGIRQDAEVRYRIDGACVDVLKISRDMVKQAVARFKILADLNIAERRKPQDGKIRFTTSKGKEIELRMATIPTANGNEDVVLRILADSKPLPLKEILPERIYREFREIINRPYGIILVVGPTGSGKTTTLHSALHCINTPEKKIWTAEDPVEITQYRLRQVQVKPMIGFTFAAAMRAFLRADPDVIMIGEMRDQETAGMAIEASLTGHMVFSTLHTNSAPETIVRLLDMGIDTFNFADSLIGVLAQRLVRTFCKKCKQAYHPDRAEYDHLLHGYGVLFFEHINIPYSEDLTFYRAKGCEACNNTGYKGRMGLYELMIANDQLRKLIIERASAGELKEEAVSNGMTVLIQEGIHLIFRGLTDYKQVMGVCGQ